MIHDMWHVSRMSIVNISKNILSFLVKCISYVHTLQINIQLMQTFSAITALVVSWRGVHWILYVYHTYVIYRYYENTFIKYFNISKVPKNLNFIDWNFSIIVSLTTKFHSIFASPTTSLIGSFWGHKNGVKFGCWGHRLKIPKQWFNCMYGT